MEVLSLWGVSISGFQAGDLPEGGSQLWDFSGRSGSLGGCVTDFLQDLLSMCGRASHVREILLRMFIYGEQSPGPYKSPAECLERLH